MKTKIYKCEKCNHSVSDSDKFCDNCGSQLQPIQDADDKSYILTSKEGGTLKIAKDKSFIELKTKGDVSSSLSNIGFNVKGGSKAAKKQVSEVIKNAKPFNAKSIASALNKSGVGHTDWK